MGSGKWSAEKVVGQFAKPSNTEYTEEILEPKNLRESRRLTTSCALLDHEVELQFTRLWLLIDPSGFRRYYSLDFCAASPAVFPARDPRLARCRCTPKMRSAFSPLSKR